MPLLMPMQRSTRRETNFTGQPITTWGTALTSDTVAHTLPAAYTQLIATTSFDTDWVNIRFHTNNAVNTITDSLVNIYVGAASAEQLLIPNLLAGWVQDWAATPGRDSRTYSFPLRIPAGSRLSARHQSIRTSQSVRCMVELLGGGTSDHWTGTMVECVGAATASSRGTNVTAGTSSEGTLTSIGTSTYDWGYIQPMLGGNSDATVATAGYESVDVAAGSDVANLITGLDDFLYVITASEFSSNLTPGRMAHVPAGTTLYLRSQGSTTFEAHDFCIYGVY